MIMKAAGTRTENCTVTIGAELNFIYINIKNKNANLGSVFKNDHLIKYLFCKVKLFKKTMYA